MHSVQEKFTASKAKLNQLTQDASQFKTEIKRAQAYGESAGVIEQLEKQLQQKEQSISKERKYLRQLESSYQQEVSTLNNALKSLQKRATQLATELKKKDSQHKQAQIALLEAKARLAATEKKLLSVRTESEQQRKQLETLKNKRAQKKNAGRELLEAKRKISDYEQEREQIEQRLATLQQENYKIKQAEREIRRQLAEKGLSDKTVADLQKKLQEQQRYAEETEHSLAAIKNRLANTEQEKQALIQQINQARREKTQYAQEAAQKTEEIERLRQTLMQEKKRYEEKIAMLNKAAKNEIAVSDKPNIEILDPPFVLTRGIPTIRLRSVVNNREIIGKITPPDSLLSLSINDEKSRVDQQGIFKKNIQLQGVQTPVQIIAVNKKGNTATLDFLLTLDQSIKRSQNNSDEVFARKAYAWKELNFGNYYALVIGNNDYQKVPDLDTPENDAKSIAEILQDKYNFKTTLLLNATRYQILSALNKLRASLAENDNLLIYYAGHGELDRVNMRGHWLPVDAEADNTANWISTTAITDILNAMAAKHILVISDSCYSGAMTRSSLARLDNGMTNKQRNDWLKAMLKLRSRTVLTSGGVSPVMDGGGGEHSVFASAFLQALQNNQSLLEGQALYRKISSNIVSIAADYGIEQVPEYAPIRHAGHESGEFFLVPKY